MTTWRKKNTPRKTLHVSTLAGNSGMMDTILPQSYEHSKPTPGPIGKVLISFLYISTLPYLIITGLVIHVVVLWRSGTFR